MTADTLTPRQLSGLRYVLKLWHQDWGSGERLARRNGIHPSTRKSLVDAGLIAIQDDKLIPTPLGRMWEREHGEMTAETPTPYTPPDGVILTTVDEVRQIGHGQIRDIGYPDKWDGDD